MANQWLRLYAEFAVDPKIQMMSESLQRRYIMLLCLRCSNDTVTLHDCEVAFQLRISDEEWATTKASFLAKNLITQDNKPASWDKRQFASDSSAARVAAYRNRQKEARNNDVTLQQRPCNALDTDTDTDTDTEEPIRAVDEIATKKNTARGTRLSADWMPSAENVAYCQDRRPDLDPEMVADNFRDYWAAKTGPGSTKANWTLTWNRWVRNERTVFRQQQRPAGRQANIDNYAAEAEAERNRHGNRHAKSERDITAEVIRIA